MTQILISCAILAVSAVLLVRATGGGHVEPHHEPDEQSPVTPDAPLDVDVLEPLEAFAPEVGVEAVLTVSAASPVGLAADLLPAPAGVGTLLLAPDPDRLIQHEVVSPVGVIARLRALLRLITAIVVFGSLLGGGIIGAARGIGLLLR
jgi:hypothetical protein